LFEKIKFLEFPQISGMIQSVYVYLLLTQSWNRVYWNGWTDFRIEFPTPKQEKIVYQYMSATLECSVSNNML